MDVRQLRYFVEVVTAKSFTRAAEMIHVAQPALGFQVRKLEEELGVRLLVRHSRGVHPTEAGEVLLRHAHSILRQVEHAKQEVKDLSGPPRGTVSVGITPTASALLATMLVQRCSRAYPGVSLNLVEGLSEEVMSWLIANRVDMGFTYNPDAARSVRSEPLMTEELYLVSKRGGEGDATTIGFSSLSKFPLIMPSRTRGTRELIERAAAEHGIELKIAFEIDSVGTTRELVESGLGHSVLPIGAVREDVRSGRLVAALIVRPRLSRTLYLGFAIDYIESSASRSVQQLVRDIAKAPVSA